MSEAGLREAYTLMKQGDKRGAAKLIQDVLREDRNNANAWWLFSHVLEDEEKIVKSLEKVLALNPEHPGARKRLSQMRPEYTNLAPTPAPLFKEKPAKPVQKSNSAVAWVLGIGAFLVSAFVSFGVVSMLFNGGFNMAPVEGPAPEEVAILQITAAFSGDYETMRQYTCDSLEDEWTELMRSMESDVSNGGLSLDDIKFDFSGIRLVESENTGRRIIFTITGEIAMEYQGQEIFSVDIRDATGFEEASIILTVSDNHWVVCSL